MFDAQHNCCRPEHTVVPFNGSQFDAKIQLISTEVKSFGFEKTSDLDFPSLTDQQQLDRFTQIWNETQS